MPDTATPHPTGAPAAETAATPLETAAPSPDPPARPSLLPELSKPEPLLPPGPQAPAWLLTALIPAFGVLMFLGWRRSASPSAVMPPRSLPMTHRDPRLLLPLAVVGGVLGALMTILFREGVYLLEWLGGGGVSSGSVEAFAEHLAPWQRILYPALGGLIAGLLLTLAQRLPGRNETDYMQAVAFGDGFLSVRHSLLKGLSSIFSVASGGSIGREGVMVQWGAAVASGLGRLFRLAPEDLRLLVAAGAAAGLAGISNAPLAATLFVAEIVLGSIALEHIGPLVVAAVIADVTVHELLGYAPSYTIPPFSLVSPWELLFYLLLGVAAGHLGPLVLHALDSAGRLFNRLPASLPLRLALGGLIVGLISVYEPLVWGNGHGAVNSVLHTHWGWQALATLFLLKLIATAATYGSGAVGGLFSPSQFFGAILGALVGTLAHWLLPGLSAEPSAYAVVGMGAFLAAVTHAPLMSILMAYELTRDYQLVLPLMLAVISAHYTARQYAGVSPMYAESLLPRRTQG